ncbi:MAG TPA: molybdopterin oxidoreductase family protein [Candidatus Eisenbacteria bacterium]|nr:molybdopterin oxidoreductase family protein [Candidatus Eisenbacteria bacterium]
MAEELEIVRGACPHDCPDTCAWDVSVREGRAVAMRGAKDHPFTRGGLCAKVSRYLDRVYAPDRLLHPMRRVGAKGEGRFERIGWDEALDRVCEALTRVVSEHGGSAVMPYSYMGTQGIVQSASLDRRFFSLLKATRLVREVCGSAPAHGFAATQGGTKGMLPEDLQHSRLILLWGTNTIVTNLHLWPFITAARKQGARVVVIDPVKTRTAESADQHVRPRPGTDAALALGLMHVIVRDGLVDHDYVARHTLGFEALRERLAQYPLDRVASLTGVSAVEVEDLARDYATMTPQAIRTLIGMGHHQHGGMMHRTIACLPGLVGAWRHRGGGLVGTASWAGMAPLNAAAVARPDLEDKTIRQVNMVQLGRALTSLEPPIRALMVYNSNPATIAPEQGRVLSGLRREDLFTVVIEQFMTDTALHADVVLPATTQVEHWDLVPSWGTAYLTLNRPAIAPLGEALPNSEIFRRLASRMGLDPQLFAESDQELIRRALDSPHPLMKGISFEALLERGYVRTAVPEDWRPYAEGGFATESGKLEFFSAALEARGLDPLPVHAAANESPEGDPSLAARFPLQLVSGKWSLHFLNSSYANLPHHLEAEGEMRAELDAGDAAARGVREGDMVRVFNDRGSVVARARLSDRVPAGIVGLPSGWWASRTATGSSVNALTDARLTDLGGGVAYHDALVDVERVMD